MKIYSTWNVQVDAKTESVAKKIAKRCAAKIGLPPVDMSADKHPGRGYLVEFEIRHDAKQGWPDMVMTIISLGQKLGKGWELEGNIQEFLGGILAEDNDAEFGVKGLLWASWVVTNEFSD